MKVTIDVSFELLNTLNATKYIKIRDDDLPNQVLRERMLLRRLIDIIEKGSEDKDHDQA